MLMVTVWWFVSAHKWFKGPKVNIEHMMHDPEQEVVEGQIPSGDVDSETGDVVTQGKDFDAAR